jgi:pilus assembly protein Flp/PilA
MLKKMMTFLRDEQGASAIEYGLIVGLIAVALVAVLVVLGGEHGLKGIFQSVVDALPGVTSH